MDIVYQVWLHSRWLELGENSHWILGHRDHQRRAIPCRHLMEVLPQSVSAHLSL